MSRKVLGSGISALMVGSSVTATSSGAMSRAASTRPSSSGSSWRWLMAMAVLAAAGLEPLAPGEAARGRRDAQIGVILLVDRL